MRFTWKNEAWDEYLYWEQQDRKTLKRINRLILSIQRDGYNKGLGDPEPLKHQLSGMWSRRINSQDRLVYVPEANGEFTIIQCRAHY